MEKRMTPGYKRKKARVLVEWVADRLKVLYPEYPDGIIIPDTSAHGEDLMFSDEFGKILGVSFEMKNQVGYGHLYPDMTQAVKNCNGRIPVLVVKSPAKEPLVIMRWSDFERNL